MSIGRDHHSMVNNGSNRLFVFGGYDKESTRSVEMYIVSQDKWHKLPDL